VGGGNSSEHSRAIRLGVGISVGICLLVGIGLLAWWLLRRKRYAEKVNAEKLGAAKPQDGQWERAELHQEPSGKAVLQVSEIDSNQVHELPSNSIQQASEADSNQLHEVSGQISPVHLLDGREVNEPSTNSKTTGEKD
jgi:hypothetical protein